MSSFDKNISPRNRRVLSTGSSRNVNNNSGIKVEGTPKKTTVGFNLSGENSASATVSNSVSSGSVRSSVNANAGGSAGGSGLSNFASKGSNPSNSFNFPSISGLSQGVPPANDHVVSSTGMNRRRSRTSSASLGSGNEVIFTASTMAAIMNTGGGSSASGSGSGGPLTQEELSKLSKAERKAYYATQYPGTQGKKGGPPSSAGSNANAGSSKDAASTNNIPILPSASSSQMGMSNAGGINSGSNSTASLSVMRKEDGPTSPLLLSTSISGNGASNAPALSTSASKGSRVPNALLFDDEKARSKAAKKQTVHRTLTQKQVPLFSHLPQYERENSYSLNIKNKESIHPSIIELGLLYADKKIIGANARCIAFLNAFKRVTLDYVMPPNEVFNRHFGHHINPMINFLVQIRPMAVPMGNAIRFLKNIIASIPAEYGEDECKEQVIEAVETYIRDRITLADELIIDYGVKKIVNGDVLLIFAKSVVVVNLILAAFQQGKKFSVIIADSRPLYEARQTLNILATVGVDCTYVNLTSVGNIINQVTKIFLGAHCIYSNGSVMSRTGTAMIAMLGYEYNVPVIVCSETYKFSHRVQLDSIVFNEIGDPDDLIDTGATDEHNLHLLDWRDIPSLKLLNLMYDVTPSKFVTMVITEIGMIPCTSVPVVLREYGSIADN